MIVKNNNVEIFMVKRVPTGPVGSNRKSWYNLTIKDNINNNIVTQVITKEAGELIEKFFEDVEYDLNDLKENKD